MKEVEDLYYKNFKFLKKETEEDLRRWKDLQFSWNAKAYIVKISILLKVICRFNAIPLKILTEFFIELERAIIEFILNNQQSRTVKIIFNNKNFLEETPPLTSSYTIEQ